MLTSVTRLFLKVSLQITEFRAHMSEINLKFIIGINIVISDLNLH